MISSNAPSNLEGRPGIKIASDAPGFIIIANVVLPLKGTVACSNEYKGL